MLFFNTCLTYIFSVSDTGKKHRLWLLPYIELQLIMWRRGATSLQQSSAIHTAVVNELGGLFLWLFNPERHVVMKEQKTFFSWIVDTVLIKEGSIQRDLNLDLSLLEVQKNWIIWLWIGIWLWKQLPIFHWVSVGNGCLLHNQADIHFIVHYFYCQLHGFWLHNAKVITTLQGSRMTH